MQGVFTRQPGCQGCSIRRIDLARLRIFTAAKVCGDWQENMDKRSGSIIVPSTVSSSSSSTPLGKSRATHPKTVNSTTAQLKICSSLHRRFKMHAAPRLCSQSC